MEFESQTVNGRPIPKEPLTFFNYNNGSRFFVTITDTPSVWQDDIPIAEKLFADMIVCPLVSENSTIEMHSSTMDLTKDVLKQRMKYPGVKEDPKLQQLARTWVLPTKINLGPAANTFTSISEKSILESLESTFETLNNKDSKINLLKIELSSGQERHLLYKVLDNGFRPSLIMMRWSYDLDEHVLTAHCAGHLLNSGYSLICMENNYCLYMFMDRPLYDIASMKTVGLDNPIMETILHSVSENMKPVEQIPSLDRVD